MTESNLRSSLWNPVSIDPDILYQAGFSVVTVWLKHIGDELHLATKLSSMVSNEQSPPLPLSPVDGTALERLLKELEFSRWVVGENLTSIQFIPAMPDRPLVIRSEVALHVPPGQDALFFAGIPVWLRMLIQPPDGTSLEEIPSQTLSNTWFGEPAAGELCYSLPFEAHRTADELAVHPCTAICPITILNRAPKDLAVQRLRVPVEHFAVYRDKEQLWTNELEVHLSGDEQSSQITIGREAPRFTNNPEILCSARQPAGKTFLKQSFSFLRSLTGI
jgi:hypothetical protein